MAEYVCDRWAERRGRVAFFAESSAGEVASPAELRERLVTRVKDRLAPYEYPREIELVGGLPKTSTGKV